MPADLVVFVPGFMGSALEYSALGPLPGQRVRELLWSENIASLNKHKLELLAYPSPGDVSPTEIIRRSIMQFLMVDFGTELYQSLIRSFDSSYGLDSRLLLFPYDWRQSIERSAKNLIRTLVDESPWNGKDSVALVGHSMGGLICRLALALSEPLRGRVKLLVYIATPLLGCLRAFWALINEPVLNPRVDRRVQLYLKSWDLLYAFKGQPGLCGDLSRAFRTFPSLYELMPPENEKPLLVHGGGTRSCMESSLWRAADQRMMAQASGVQRALNCRLDIPMCVIHSQAHPTDYIYSIGSRSVLAVDVRRRGDGAEAGDNTVTAQSATYGCPQGAIYAEESEPNDHVGLCRNQRVLALVHGRIIGI